MEQIVSIFNVSFAGQFISPLPVKPGDYRFPRRLSFCPSVCLSVRPSVCPSVRLSVSHLGVRLLGFPNFSQSSFDILTWNLVYGFVLNDIIQIKLLFGCVWPTFTWVIALAEISFSWLFFVIFQHIELKFHIWICLDIIQVKFDFGRVWPTFTWVIALC